MIGIAGAGAFGTALAVALAQGGAPVRLWGRSGMAQMATTRTTPRLQGIRLPDSITVTEDPADLMACDILLLAVPMQALAQTLAALPAYTGAAVACCKGVDLQTLLGPAEVISAAWPEAQAAVLSGPSFAADIAHGLPTALSLACRDARTGARLQEALSTPVLRLYRTQDVAGVELGGALKNVIAIACGCAMGAGLGESARASLMTRGFAEMQRLAAALGAEPETLQGLSGFGDLVLTCTSAASRNYAFGLSLGQGTAPATATVEGRATAQAVAQLARTRGIDMPITRTVADLVTGTTTVKQAITDLLNRRLKEE
jgi:glycerol-3-phosphate dehydrogenase (NAD(P)+)